MKTTFLFYYSINVDRHVITIVDLWNTQKRRTLILLITLLRKDNIGISFKY